MWIAHNATITSTGTMPGLEPGTVELTMSYDFEQKMEKHEIDRPPPGGVFLYGFLLEGGGWTRPTHACHLALCLANDTVLDAWVHWLSYAIGVWAITLLSTPANRLRLARRTSIAHVQLALSEVNLSTPERARSTSPAKRRPPASKHD